MTSAFIVAFIPISIAGIAGYFIKSKIWNKGKPQSVIDYGRYFSAYAAFIVPMSSIHSFIRKDFDIALIGFSINMAIFIGLFFIIGLLYGKIKLKQFKSGDQNINYYYEQALNELEENKFNKAIWAKSFAESDGNESKAKAAYIRARSNELSIHHLTQIDNRIEERALTKKTTVNKSTAILIIALAATLTGIYIYIDADPAINPSQRIKSPEQQSHESTNNDFNIKPIEKSLISLATETVDVPVLPNILGKWRCVDGEDVIDTFEQNGIYRRLWVKQKQEFIYRWNLLKDGEKVSINRTELSGSQHQMNILILTATSNLLEIVYPSGVVEKCKPIKINSSKSAIASNTTKYSNSSLAKDLMGRWQMTGGWTFDFKNDGNGLISLNASPACGEFKYIVKDNTLSVSNFSGACKSAGGVSHAVCNVEIDEKKMKMECANGHTTEWNKIQ